MVKTNDPGAREGEQLVEFDLDEKPHIAAVRELD